MRVINLGLSLLTYTSLIGHGQAFSSSFDSSLQRPLRSNADILGQNTSDHNGTLLALLESMHAMQDNFYEISIATWPDAIDWTAAVIATQVFSGITSLNQARTASEHSTHLNFDNGKIANEISRFFLQATSSYYGQNALGIRYQANDDMLWVTLEWLEALKFIHTSAEYQSAVPSQDWFGNQYNPLYAHRARVFWELAEHGYDTVLCGGGMTWNNRLAPYKNAITNELFISASVGMYLYFPGDNDTSTYNYDEGHDKRYLTAAIDTYDWLLTSNMTNTAGLFVDGFHIRGWTGGPSGSNGTGQCDQRNDMVYTYNQGVLLTGQRDLYLATSNETFLHNGHALVQSAIAATGWPDITLTNATWSGLGAAGVMEDYCDALGSCNQDGQLFKGIFFAHFARFCEALPTPTSPSRHANAERKAELANWHVNKCLSYKPWVAHNAAAALRTRDENGVMGMWWTAGLPDEGETDEVASETLHGRVSAHGTSARTDLLRKILSERKTLRPPGVDYRNAGVPETSTWRVDASQAQDARPANIVVVDHGDGDETEDPNLRGRGRTVETQASGVAVIMALLKIELLEAMSAEI